MSEATIAVLDRLVDRVSVLKPILDEHQFQAGDEEVRELLSVSYE